VSIVCSLCFTCDDIIRLRFIRFSVTPIVVLATDCLLAGPLTHTHNYYVIVVLATDCLLAGPLTHTHNYYVISAFDQQTCLQLLRLAEANFLHATYHYCHPTITIKALKG